MLRLQSWGSAWLSHLLDPVSGKHHLTLQNPHSPQATVGFASYEPVMFGFWRRFYAAYGKNGRFIFQAGRDSWDLTDEEIHVDLKLLMKGLASSITIMRQAQVLHRTTLIHPFRALSSFIDPTYDSIDFQDHHFFSYLSNTLTSPDAKNHVAAKGSVAAA